MMTTSFEPSSMFYSVISSSSRAFEFPANVRRRKIYPVKSGGKTFKASSPTTTTTTSNEDSNENGFRASNRRRGLIFTTILPFLFPLHESIEGFGAKAADSSESIIIQEGVRKVLSKVKAAGVLRLVFHDAGTFDMDENSGGMNGSILYELERPENAVSWADMIAVAGAEAVTLCGGPVIPVQLGRLDSMVPDPEGKLPEESLNASGLKQCFQRKGFSTQELVAMSGAHTLGSKGFGNPNAFDNSYFKILLEKPWMSSAGMTSMIGLPSDRALTEDDECLRWIVVYADDQNRFFEDFKNAYIKLVNSGARWKKV
ncbi:hypothetical protein HHK36_013931 [Tetracentron sinense]|uniref:L-ascorbate peroxidase n=1 Tax=Tetracentron sinense TaxID=13715 RepID=A0A834Z758_TETSI|nr:hypothetical protein HHK36_013931 [Tetracentron sinense]